MATTTEIEKAIGAHGMWKVRLKTAIDTGRMDAPLAAIKADLECPFGQWLLGRTIAPSTKASAHYASVRQLHAEFHDVASQVAELALSGKHDEAGQMLAHAGDFSQASAKLTGAMMEWKRALS